MDTKLIQTALAPLASWEARDLGLTASILTEDFVLTGPAPEPLNKEAWLGFQAIHNAAFADWKFNVKTVEVQSDDMVKVTIQITATHTGAYDVAKLGVPVPAIAPTGKQRTWPVEYFFLTLMDGKVSRVDVHNAPDGGVIGTLAWLGVQLPEMA